MFWFNVLDMNSLSLDEHRCKCGKLLLKGIFFDGTLEIKCKKCSEMNNIGIMKQTTDKSHYVLIIDGHGVITNVNDSACDILGYIRDELVGQHFALINPNIPIELGKKFFGSNSVLSDENYFKLDTNHKSKNGQNIPVVASFKLYKPNKNEKHLLLLAELKKCADNGKFTKVNEFAFIDNACDFYFDIDKSGIIEYVSASVEKLSGYSQESVIGHNYFDFIPVDRKNKEKETFEYFSLNKQPYRVVHDILIDKNGKTVDNELYFTSRFDDYGKFVGYRVLGWIKKDKIREKSLDV